MVSLLEEKRRRDKEKRIEAIKNQFALIKSYIDAGDYPKAKAELKFFENNSNPKVMATVAKIEAVIAEREKVQEQEKRRKRRQWGIIAWVVFAIIVLWGVVILMQQIERQNERNEAIATLSIDVSSTLSAYCKYISGKSQGACRRWAATIIDTHLNEALFCDSEYDWVRDEDTDSFSLCLLTMGIAVLGDEPIIQPLDLADLNTEENISLIVSVSAYCNDTQPEDFCRVWTYMTYSQNWRPVTQCASRYIRPQRIFEFYNCLESEGLVPRKD